MKAQDVAQKAAAYFRSQSGLTRLLAGCVEKYRRHGRLAGGVMLPKASEEERQALEALRRRLEAEETLLISLREVALALQDTCCRSRLGSGFAGICRMKNFFLGRRCALWPKSSEICFSAAPA